MVAAVMTDKATVEIPTPGRGHRASRSAARSATCWRSAPSSIRIDAPGLPDSRLRRRAEIARGAPERAAGASAAKPRRRHRAPRADARPLSAAAARRRRARRARRCAPRPPGEKPLAVARGARWRARGGGRPAPRARLAAPPGGSRTRISTPFSHAGRSAVATDGQGARYRRREDQGRRPAPTHRRRTWPRRRAGSRISPMSRRSTSPRSRTCAPRSTRARPRSGRS